MVVGAFFRIFLALSAWWFGLTAAWAETRVALVVGNGAYANKAVLPNPAELGDRMRGRTSAGSLVRGLAKDGTPKEAYLYQIVDNEWTMREYGHQAVVWQTAVHPVVACELIAQGVWQGAGVLGPEAFDAVPFLDLLVEHRVPHVVEDRRKLAVA
jgi:saccharopine dehydrogenase-like NADP-dependent oxidoreductase